MPVDPKDSMLVIAAYFKNGEGTMPGAKELADKLAKMLTGEMGLFLVYSTESPTPAPTVNWWDGKTPRFDCHAKTACKVWRIPVTQEITVGIADTQAPLMILNDGRRMDVWEVIRRPGEPTWFRVYPEKPATTMLICLAGETQAKPV